MKSLLFVVVIAGGLVMRADAQERIYEKDDGVSLPKVVRDVKPQYPPGPFRDGVVGKVHLRCVVDTMGRPTAIEVVEALHDELDKAAVEALGQWEFEPGTLADKPVSVRITVEMAFTRK